MNEKFATILHRAANRHGGEDALRAKLLVHGPQYASGLIPKTDDRWLAEFTKRVFQAGFSWKVIEAKWQGFEDAFWNFKISKCSNIDMDDMERLTSDKGIVRNPIKIKTVAPNARMIAAMTEQSGSADAFIRNWPRDDYIGLFEYLQKHGSHLGMNTVGHALRFSGVPSFMLSSDVSAALIHAGVIEKPATSKAARRAVQTAFNAWVDESGEDITFISRVLALSIDS